MIAQVFVGYADPDKVLALAIAVKAGLNVWTHLAFLPDSREVERSAPASPLALSQAVA